MLAVIILPLFTGCFGVGEDDPFISLRSRKARVVGSWDVSSYYKNVKQTFGTDNNTVLRVITDVQGDDWLETTYLLGTDSVREVEGLVLNHSMAFDKNGYFSALYEYEIVTKTVDDNTLETTTTTFTFKDEMDGTWNFLAGIDDYKNKERLSLVILNSRIVQTTVEEVKSDDQEGPADQTVSVEAWTYNYANGEMSVIWELDMLKSKEINMYQDINNFYQSTADIAGSAYTEVGYQEKNLVLKANAEDLQTE
jgi:hypothetical protein